MNSKTNLLLNTIIQVICLLYQSLTQRELYIVARTRNNMVGSLLPIQLSFMPRGIFFPELQKHTTNQGFGYKRPITVSFIKQSFSPRPALMRKCSLLASTLDKTYPR